MIRGRGIFRKCGYYSRVSCISQFDGKTMFLSSYRFESTTDVLITNSISRKKVIDLTITNIFFFMINRIWIPKKIKMCVGFHSDFMATVEPQIRHINGKKRRKIKKILHAKEKKNGKTVWFDANFSIYLLWFFKVVKFCATCWSLERNGCIFYCCWSIFLLYSEIIVTFPKNHLCTWKFSCQNIK